MDDQILPPSVRVAEYTKIEAGIAKLAEKYGKVLFDVTTAEGDKAARAARQECVKLRTSLEAKRKEIKAPALQRCKDIDDEAKRITEAIAAIERPIDEQIKAEEKRKADEKAERERIEAQRREQVSQAINDMAFLPVYAAGKSSETIAGLIEELRSKALTEDEFDARIGEAGIVKSAAIAKLEELHAQAVAVEDEKARIEKDRADLEAQKAELEKSRAALQAPEPTPDPVEHSEPNEATAQEVSESDRFFSSLTAPEAIETIAHSTDDVAPSLYEIAELVAEHFDVDHSTAREWIISAVNTRGKE